MTRTQYHVCYNLEHVQKILLRDKHDSLFLTVDGRPATKAEIAEVVFEAISKGYEVLPPCDNVTETGRCAGHEVTA